MSAKVNTVTADGLARLLQQFEGSVKLRAWIGSYLNQIQALEDAAWPILGERSLAAATGHRLDGVGQIFQVFRGGRNDTDYRLAIQAEIAILLSTGTAEDLLEIAQLMIVMGTPDYFLTEYFPKSVYLRPINHILVQDAAFVTAMLKRSVSAATTLLFVYALSADTAVFRLSSQVSSSETSALLGMADTAQTTGGHLANSL
jgi:hypothetical protein